MSKTTTMNSGVPPSQSQPDYNSQPSTQKVNNYLLYTHKIYK